IFANGAALLVGQAGSSAVLVATLIPPGDVGGLDRCVDALIGGGVGLLVASVLPSDPVGPVRREARALLDELAAVLARTGDALRDRDAEAAAAALGRARASQPLIDELRGALRGGHEVTRVSPMLRRRRRVLGKFAELAERADYAMRNARVLVRRTYTALCDDEPAAPELADVLRELAAAVRTLTDQLGRDGDRERAREPLLDVVRHVRVLTRTWMPGPSEVVIVAQLRSIALDLLQGTGMSRNEALAAMRGPLDPD
ncbi:MAG TPA: aromatic acid exporter family protein, partial [Pseudonocardia sp.]|nr:aromatic acid exporter family protein [Pseudonocardia sp.]